MESLNKTYAIHEVKVTRKEKTEPNTHEGWEYEKGDFVRNVSINEDMAKLFNEQSHNARIRYYEVDAAEVSEQAAGAEKKGKKSK